MYVFSSIFTLFFAQYRPTHPIVILPSPSLFVPNNPCKCMSILRVLHSVCDTPKCNNKNNNNNTNKRWWVNVPITFLFQPEDFTLHTPNIQASHSQCIMQMVIDKCISFMAEEITVDVSIRRWNNGRLFTILNVGALHHILWIHVCNVCRRQRRN